MEDCAMWESGSEVIDLIERARRGDSAVLGRLLEENRTALIAEAERQLRGRLAARVDSADIIQQTFLEAHRGFERFEGQTEIEFSCWLRTILNRNIAGQLRDHTRAAKRDVRRECSLDDSRGDGEPLWRRMVAAHSSPSQHAVRAEDFARLAGALGDLTNDQREAVRLRHLEGWPLVQIAERLGRTQAATAGLIKRGVKALRERIDGEE
jgi:RNA polymerase sigma-70 factor (ECF subfamily)